VATRQAHLNALKPYLIGEAPRPGNGEWDMFCPLHEDLKRSASLNVESSEWFCAACSHGGSVVELIRQQEDWVPPPTAATNGTGRRRKGRTAGTPEDLPSETELQGCQSALLSNDDRLDWLIENRMLTTDTIVQFGIGWDRDLRCYTIPVRGADGELQNVRRYDPNPRDERRKIWGVTGHNETRLYPYSQLDADDLVLAFGEWDALLTIQMGFPTVTVTGADKVWASSWSPLFKGKRVWVVADRDDDGLLGAIKRAKAIQPYADDVMMLELPYEVEPKHGKDLTDFWREYGVADFRELQIVSDSLNKKVVDDEPELITVLDSFDSLKVGKPTRMLVTIKGKREPGYTVPSKALLMCDKSAGDRCKHCTMNATEGQDEFEILPSDSLVLELMDASTSAVLDAIRRRYGAQKCTRLTIEPTGHQAVEVLFARPSIDHTDGSSFGNMAGDYKNIKITSAGRHDTTPNSTVRVTGALYPNPKSQTNEWLAHEVSKQATSVDHFELTPDAIKLMKRFQTTGRPLKKIAEIAKQLSKHVTHIYGRPEMHVLMDLVWHSVTAWKFGGELVTRGWAEALVVGDTQQGKSETARALMRHYQAGERVSCESASFAGVVGGLQTFGQGKEWAVTWGAIPINNGRLVVLEEVSGLTTEEISQMSDIRSEGVARITKIQTEETTAQTRLLWIGNPREALMSDFTYGVQAIRPLIGNNEDIARFDMAMSVSAGEVDPELMNREHGGGELRYTSEACATLVRWAWTRKPDQVTWARGAEQAVRKAAMSMAANYSEDPPLVQAANQRLKIARLAIAIAARTFSTDETCELLVVRPDHVEDAVAFLDRIYGLRGFGYAERSKELIGDRAEARKHYDDIKIYLLQRTGLAKFLRNSGKFRRQDIEEVLNTDRTDANAVVNTLLNARMVRKDGADVRVEPTLHELLREVKV
jgi:hypothetical protein